MIDYGCGSGILAIATALLGADKIHAVDNDPQAIDATVDNSLRNDLPVDKITAYLPEALPKLQADFYWQTFSPNLYTNLPISLPICLNRRARSCSQEFLKNRLSLF